MNRSQRIAPRFQHRSQAASLLGLTLAAWLGVVSTAAVAQQSATRVYRCGSDDGTPLYQNAPGKGCRLLELPPINSVPAAQVPNVIRDSANSSRGGTGARVDRREQQGRDTDRRRILEAELAREQSRLEDVRKEYNGGAPERHGDERNYQKYLDRVERLKQQLKESEQNIGSLRREIDAL